MSKSSSDILGAYEYDVHYYGGGRRRVLEAMDEYAKSQCIAFQEFIRKGGYKQTLFGLYSLHTDDSEKMAAFSIHHLYDLFIQHQTSHQK